MPRSVALLIAVLICAASTQASAVTAWSMNASSCVPGDPAIHNNRYLVTAGSVKHQAAATGLITLYCPVSLQLLTAEVSPIFCAGTDGFALPCLIPLAIGANVLRLTYRDGDGTVGAGNITAQLLRLSTADGSFSAVSNSFVDSNTNPSTAQTAIESDRFSDAFNLDSFYYYVRVDLNRTSPAVDVTFYGVSLESK